jgi:heme a synthase
MRLIRNKRSPAVASGVHRFAVLTAIATLGLVGVGGLVTSHEVGMAVWDWPNTYGYNMFFFPVSRWVGGIFYEHTHRLVASAVGLMTAVLALWLYGWRARPFMRWAGLVLFALGLGTGLAMPRRWTDGVVLAVTGLALSCAGLVWPRCEASAKWLRRLGMVAFCAVVLQGVLGGLRVILSKDAIGIFHAALAQLFFALVCALALFTSRWWQNKGQGGAGSAAVSSSQTGAALRWGVMATTGLILVQLILGAVMRHQHAGLAIPDFPLAYGKLWPAMDPASITSYNQHRIEVLAVKPITAFQVGLQMVHRIAALCILAAVACCAWAARRAPGRKNLLSALTLVWLGLILTQVALGAVTIWSDKAADIATAHVLVGALSLALGVIVCIISPYEQVAASRVIESSPPAEVLNEPPRSHSHAGALGSQPA